LAETSTNGRFVPIQPFAESQPSTNLEIKRSQKPVLDRESKQLAFIKELGENVAPT